MTGAFCKPLPLGYDGYILHLSEVSERVLEDLLRENPQSLLWGITGSGHKGNVWSHILNGGSYYQFDSLRCYDVLQAIGRVFGDERLINLEG